MSDGRLLSREVTRSDIGMSSGLSNGRGWGGGGGRGVYGADMRRDGKHKITKHSVPSEAEKHQQNRQLIK